MQAFTESFFFSTDFSQILPLLGNCYFNFDQHSKNVLFEQKVLYSEDILDNISRREHDFLAFISRSNIFGTLYLGDCIFPSYYVLVKVSIKQLILK